ncbi:MAG TPA: anti-phage dCTP deaminase [Candidatus Angelobacter sp.]|jgi:deoxycytidylate deaminase
MTAQPLQIKNAVERFDFPQAELIIGVVCAVGTDYGPIRDAITDILSKFNYHTTVVRISDLISRFSQDKLSEETETLRISSRMTAGNNECRNKKRKDLWALAAISEINATRERMASGPHALTQTAHLVLTLKRPEEVATLRKVYGDGFLLVGVFSTEQERLEYLIEKNAPKSDALDLIKRDAEEANDDYGQYTTDTFHLADVFVQTRRMKYKEELQRFFDLVFSDPYKTPTKHEHGMFLAYAASLRSGQLGRQVGAAITSDDGEVLSVGCNDVPKPGGGLYWPGTSDNRDHVWGEDTNDKQRDKIISQLISKIENQEKQRKLLVTNIVKEILGQVEKTEEKIAELSAAIERFNATNIEALRPDFKSALDITEYGRAVHAEMDALLTCARSGISPRQATLYTTTFPCHNCTRHIIAAGIKRVYYIEPYGKSRAEELHEDAIIVEEKIFGKRRQGLKRVPFTHFVGIGPRRYFDLFSLSLSRGHELIRKKSGRTLRIEPSSTWIRLPLSPYNYLEKEQIAVEMLDELYSQQLDIFKASK